MSDDIEDEYYEHPTKENTHFAEWWLLMHRATLTLKANPASYAEAHPYYDAMMTPGDAARDFAAGLPPEAPPEAPPENPPEK